jgi:hypothetical protein
VMSWLPIFQCFCSNQCWQEESSQGWVHYFEDMRISRGYVNWNWALHPKSMNDIGLTNAWLRSCTSRCSKQSMASCNHPCYSYYKKFAKTLSLLDSKWILMIPVLPTALSMASSTLYQELPNLRGLHDKTFSWCQVWTFLQTHYEPTI